MTHRGGTFSSDTAESSERPSNRGRDVRVRIPRASNAREAGTANGVCRLFGLEKALRKSNARPSMSVSKTQRLVDEIVDNWRSKWKRNPRCTPAETVFLLSTVSARWCWPISFWFSPGAPRNPIAVTSDAN